MQENGFNQIPCPILCRWKHSFFSLPPSFSSPQISVFSWLLISFFNLQTLQSWSEASLNVLQIKIKLMTTSSCPYMMCMEISRFFHTYINPKWFFYFSQGINCFLPKAVDHPKNQLSLVPLQIKFSSMEI
jgi:hypothetical protein